MFPYFFPMISSHYSYSEMSVFLSSSLELRFPVVLGRLGSASATERVCSSGGLVPSHLRDVMQCLARDPAPIARSVESKETREAKFICDFEEYINHRAKLLIQNKLPSTTHIPERFTVLRFGRFTFPHNLF